MAQLRIDVFPEALLDRFEAFGNLTQTLHMSLGVSAAVFISDNREPLSECCR